MIEPLQTLKAFWSNINNVQLSSPEDIQSDILYYLSEIERMQTENVELQQVREKLNMIEKAYKEGCGDDLDYALIEVFEGGNTND